MARAKKSDILSDFIREKDVDTERLAALVEKAKGNRSVTEFASVCGVNPSTMSRLINGKNNTASSDELIVAIAMNADPNSGVTFQQLVNAHGMFIIKEEYYQEEAMAERYDEIFQRIIVEVELRKRSAIKPFMSEQAAAMAVREIVTSELMERGYTVGLAQDCNIMFDGTFSCRADFVLKTNALSEEGLSQWAFDVKLYNGSNINRFYFKNIFSLAYLDSPRDSGKRVTLVVCDKTMYQVLRDDIRNLTIWDSVSLMWVDLQERKIKAEFVIESKAKVNVVRLFDIGEEPDYQEIYGVPEEDDE